MSADERLNAAPMSAIYDELEHRLDDPAAEAARSMRELGERGVVCMDDGEGPNNAAADFVRRIGAKSGVQAAGLIMLIGAESEPHAYVTSSKLSALEQFVAWESAARFISDPSLCDWVERDDFRWTVIGVSRPASEIAT